MICPKCKIKTEWNSEFNCWECHKCEEFYDDETEDEYIKDEIEQDY